LPVLLLVVVTLSDPASLAAQWQEECCLFSAQDSARTGYTNCRNLVVQGDLVHSLWMDKENGEWRPTYRRSMDGGSTWENAVHLAEPNTTWPRHLASFAVHESTVYAVWADERSGESRIYMRVSADNGRTWTGDRCISPEGLECYYPAIAFEHSSVHVVYTERVPSSRNIKYIRSSDGGEHWTKRVSLSSSSYAEAACITIEGSVIHICWYEFFFGQSEIMYRRSTDGGATWENSVRLSQDPGVQNGCTIAVSGDDVHIAWHDYRTGFFDVHYVYSWDGGAHWGEEEPVMVTPYDCYFPTLAVSDQTLHLAWVDKRNDPGDIYYCRSDDAGRTWGLEEPVVSSPLRSRYPFLAISGDALHLLWTDDYREVRHMRNPTGNAGTTVARDPVATPGYTFDQNYPNPFSTHTSMQYRLSAVAHVCITLHDMLGRELRILLDDMRNPGTHVIQIDGSELPAGNYLCRMTVGKDTMTRLISVMHH